MRGRGRGRKIDPFETLTLLEGSGVFEGLHRGKSKGLKGNKTYKNP